MWFQAEHHSSDSTNTDGIWQCAKGCLSRYAGLPRGKGEEGAHGARGGQGAPGPPGAAGARGVQHDGGRHGAAAPGGSPRPIRLGAAAPPWPGAPSGVFSFRIHHLSVAIHLQPQPSSTLSTLYKAMFVPLLSLSAPFFKPLGPRLKPLGSSLQSYVTASVLLGKCL